jgi:hypothetical protein
MPRTVGTAVENNLSKGLVTEATALTFPENAVSDALNVIFNTKGNTVRRNGFDLETDPAYVTYTPTTGLVREYFWDASGFINNTLYLVLQVGSKIYFYDVANPSSISPNIDSFVIDLATYATGVEGDLPFTPCAFASGQGFLFITNPLINPIYVQYDTALGTFVTKTINVQIRDIEGLDDGLGTEERPVSLSTNHNYNLLNQGWYKQVRVGSANNEV